jgi:hypothetical protein
MFNSVKRMRLIGSVVWTLLLLAAGVSASHIVESAHKLGLHDWQAYTAPALIDLVAIVGKLSMAACFSPAFRKSGFRLLMTGGLLSLACNVYAGDNLGERAFGVLVVGAFMLLEHHATKASRASILPTPDEVDDELKAKRRAAALKGAETRRQNKVAVTKPARKPRAPKPATVEALEAAYAMPDAPVSPA